MSLQIYKPNKNNNGCGFSFSCGQDKNSKETFVFISAILQHSWDEKNKRGTFIGSKDDPSKNITIKLNEFECGAILSAIKNRHEWNTFHKTSDSQTSIKFSPWDKKENIKTYDPSTKDFKTKSQTVPAFGLNISRPKGNSFKVPLEPGELECISSFLNTVLDSIYKKRISKLLNNHSYTEPFDD